MDYRTIYSGTQSIFAILFAVLYALYRSNRTNQRFSKQDLIYIFFFITSVLDSIWVYINGVPEYRVWHILLETVYLSSMALTGYIWFLISLDLFPSKAMKIRKFRYVLSIPVIASVILIFCSIKTQWMFVVDENGLYIRGKYHIYMVIMNYLYMVLGSVLALRYRKEALLSTDRRRLLVAALFPVPILILSGAQMLLPPGLPAMQGGVLVALFLLYGTTQSSLITRDYLTDIPNKYAFEQDLMNRLADYHADGSKHLYLLAGDLDNFKSINDSYGHPVGDSALVLAATTMNDFFSDYGAAVFRTGGDEFMVLCESGSELDIDKLQSDLNEELAKASASEKYKLGISLGMIEYDESMNFRTFIERADIMLYSAKEVRRSSAWITK